MPVRACVRVYTVCAFCVCMCVESASYVYARHCVYKHECTYLHTADRGTRRQTSARLRNTLNQMVGGRLRKTIATEKNKSNYVN